jgi:hypothetical protein
MGLPGSTSASFRNDLQQCINRDVQFRMHTTQLLPNSPMNDPSYREENGIVAQPGELVMQTSSFTREEFDRNFALGTRVLVLDVWGVLRHFARYVRSETGIREMDFYEGMLDHVESDVEQWPAIGYLAKGMTNRMLPPVSWQRFIDEVHRYCVSQLGMVDDDALATALSVQHALLPAPDRSFPDERLLAHDVVAWHRHILDAIESGRRDDWELVVPRLRELPPARFVVDDPNGISRHAVGQSLTNLSFNLASWELESPLARARLATPEAVI